MRINSFFYTIGQGFKNLGRNKWYTLASIATITACLFLFGLFYAIITNFQNVVKTAEEGVSVTVFFNEGTTEDEILAIKSDLEKRTEVREIQYVSADEAWEGFKEEYLGEYADGFTENPLADSANLIGYPPSASSLRAFSVCLAPSTLRIPTAAIIKKPGTKKGNTLLVPARAITSSIT